MNQNLSIKDDGIGFNSDSVQVEEIKSLYHPHIRATGDHIVVKPYIRPSKVGVLLVNEDIRSEDGHHSTVAQVIDIGPTAYTDPKHSGGLIWCQIGDWVIIPRVAGVRVVRQMGDDSTMFRIIKEDAICAVVNDPSEWEIRVSTTRF